MRIFVNNVDGYVAGAICADLVKVSKNIVGTRKCIRDELVPPMVKRIVPRVDVRRFLKAVTACNVVIYDLHDADFEELELLIRMLQMSEISHDLTFVVISSIGVWSRSSRSYEEIPPRAPPEPPESGAEDAVPAPPPPPEGDTSAAEDGEAGEEAAEVQESAPPLMRPVAFKSEDYVKRLPAPKFQEWKDIETQVLALKEKPGGNIRPYVVCAGVPYGNGEDAFLGLFKAAWQSRPTLRVIGEGSNFIPMVHCRDLARLTRHVVEVCPPLDYHLAVDRGDVTQKSLIQAVAKQFELPYDPAPVTVAEAILAELADIMTINLRFEPSYLMEVPWEVPPAPVEEEEAKPKEREGTKQSTTPEPKTEENPSRATSLMPPEGKKKERPNSAASSQQAEPKEPEPVQEAEEPGPPPEVPPPGFRWWCEGGLVENMLKVATEFRRWRQLIPVKLCIAGPMGCGSSQLCHKLAETYHVPALLADELIPDFASRDTPLGQQLKEQQELIAANAANPKSQGPFVIPSHLVAKVMEEAMAEATGTHRGWIVGGFPTTLEEAAGFFAEMPPPDPNPPKKGKEAEAINLDDLKLKEELKPDVFVTLSSAREVCQARLESKGDLLEKEFIASTDQWNKDCEAIGELFTRRLGATEVKLSSDTAAEAEREKHEAAVKAAEQEEQEAPPAPDEKDLIVLASSDWTWIDHGSSHISQVLEELRPVFNFLPPAHALASSQPSKAESGGEAVAVPEAPPPNEEKLRQEMRIESVKKEELARLEKHSEPLRLYLMKFVVPALTGALVELCHEQPEDPVAYLAEYLALYSEVARESGRELR